MKPKNIVKKEPFKRMLPYSQHSGYTAGNEKVEVGLPENQWMIVPQERFLAELNPSAHDVNNVILRQDKIVKDKDGNVTNSKSVARIAVALQELISTKQRVHLTANPIKFTLTEPQRTKDKEDDFVMFKQAWMDKNMHVYLSNLIESWLDTGDGALYTYRDNNVFGCKAFSFKNGDVLFPHYDYYGNLETFGRMYSSVNEKGKTVTMLDVFDKINVTTYRNNSSMLGRMFTGEWSMLGNPKPHGFREVPIVYKRSNDTCWGSVQPLIDSYEEAISNMSENNRYYANMILFIKGEVGKLPDRDGAGKVLQGKGDADAKFLATSESNEAQVNELDILLKQIFLGSFTVNVSPDSVKSSGDLPGITVKLLFSPATEKALDSAKKMDKEIDKLVRLFKRGYGLEIEKSTEMENLKLRGEIDIYTPENEAELAQIINDGIFSKAISQETGQELYPVAVNGEKERVDAQIKKEQAAETASSINYNN